MSVAENGNGGEVRRRVSYREAGEAHRLALERARWVGEGLTVVDWKVLHAVFEATVSYSKLSDCLTLAQISEAALCSRSGAIRSLRKLHDWGVLTYRPRRGQGKLSEVDLTVEEGQTERMRTTAREEERCQVADTFREEEKGVSLVTPFSGGKGVKTAPGKVSPTRARVDREVKDREEQRRIGNHSTNVFAVTSRARGSESANTRGHEPGGKSVSDEEHHFAEQALAVFNQETRKLYTLTPAVERMILERRRENPELGLDDHRAAIQATVREEWVKDVKPALVWSSASFESALARAGLLDAYEDADEGVGLARCRSRPASAADD